MDTMRVADEASVYAAERFAPEPERRRHGVALCLSGGGYRAALFHLGALRRLNELGILTQVDTVSSVSGGSIIAAHLARQSGGWDRGKDGEPVPAWEPRVAAPFRAFCRRNIRTGAVGRRFLPWHWRNERAAVEGLAKSYERRLTPARFDALPVHPRFVFCATDEVFGVNWEFVSRAGREGQSRAGDWRAGYRIPIPAEWTVARAVAASSCFPPVFDPLPLDWEPEALRGGRYGKGDRDELVRGIRLSDGGVYDNMGLEPVWKSARVVLVSDGGGVFESEARRGRLGRVSRQLSIVESQSRGLRKRWLIAGFLSGTMDGAYWGIGSSTDHYDVAERGYSAALVDEVISEIRTDLDAFSWAEIAVLENHGYLMADAAARTHLPELIRTDARTDVPHPAWENEGAVQEALRHSHKRSLLGRWR